MLTEEARDQRIYILREAVAEFRSPVMVYSIGKDSFVLLHLAMKGLLSRQAAVPTDALLGIS